MKRLAILLIAIGGLLSGCIPVYEGGPRGRGGHEERGHDGGSNHADHDGDGVPNRRDGRPNDPHRY